MNLANNIRSGGGLEKKIQEMENKTYVNTYEEP